RRRLCSMSSLLEETEAKLMQIAACRPVSVCLKPPSTPSRVTPCIFNSWQSVSHSTAAKADVEWRQRQICPQFYLDYRATVFSWLPGYRETATAAVVTVLVLGNDLRADIKRPGPELSGSATFGHNRRV